jgi:medium-chain acyl-[acyl-carrier-protein] hydrolase
MKRSPWLPFGTGDDASVRLLSLPHAGASAAAYRAWGSGLAPWIAVCPLQPPGRGKRRGEAPFTSASQLVKSLTDEITANVREPFALFGHSTGALCAFEAARELRRVRGPQPLHLFVSGRRAPQIPMDRHNLEAMDLPELAAFLRRLGGTPEEILADQAMLSSLRMIITADFQVNELYEYVDGPPLETPITAFAGTHDLSAAPALMAPWQEQTTGRFALHQLDGGHFAAFDRRGQVHSLIVQGLAQSPD